MHEWIATKLREYEEDKIKGASRETGIAYEDYLEAIEHEVIWGETNHLILENVIEQSIDVIINRFAEQPGFEDEE